MNILRILIVLSFILTPISAFSGQKLSGEEITKTFSGHTYSWTHTKRNDSGKTFLSEDGTVKSVKNGKSRDGGWIVKGNKLCFTTGKKICREIESDGKGGYYLVKDGSKRVINIQQVEQGNTI